MINKQIVDILHAGGIGVLPTDTIYGLVGSALNKKTVERIYKLRRRNPKKPMIILISSIRDLVKFGVKPDKRTVRFLKAVWLSKLILSPFSNSHELENGPVSVILPLGSARAIRKFKYLHRGTKTLAFRLPKLVRLRKLLQKTDPLVAPSANWEGRRPARTIKEAKKYFGDKAGFYVDAGRVSGKPSALIKIENGEAITLRRR